ncbi:MAG: V-type ATP synthase subunit I [Lacrimispora saccharolytica]
MIVKMKFISITGPKSDIDRVVNTYLSKYEIHLENALTELKTIQSLTPYLQINPYKDTLKLANDYAAMLPVNMREKAKKLSLEEAIACVENIDQTLTRLNQEHNRLQEQMKIYKEKADKIAPFQNLPCSLSSILDFKFIRLRFGRIPKEYFEKFNNYVYESCDTVFYRCNSDDRYVWGVYFAPREEINKIDAVYASMHFERVYVPDEYEGTLEDAHRKLHQQILDTYRAMSDCKAQMQDCLRKHAEELVGAVNELSTLSGNFDVRRLAACTSNRKGSETFYILCGWMSEADTEAFQHDIENDENLYCFIEDEDHNPLREPPTKLKNPKLFRPFEMYVQMYGLPSYHEMDPTIFVGLTYAFIFGAMFGDVGQGLCLVIGGALLYKFRKITLAAIISLAGIFSTLFGFLYGSFFGFEELLPALWLKPKEAMISLPLIGQMNTVFVVAIAFGMFLILVTMIFHIINALRAHRKGEALFDQNAIAGLIFYGAVVATIVLYLSGHALPATGVLVVMFVIPLIAIFLKEPLEKLVEKKKNAFPKTGKVMFFVQSFFELFEILLSYFSNTLSFVRIGAFAVSHAAMMEVVLMLAGATDGGSINWLVVVLGNIFVCAMEGLIVGIQVLRLEYYELFSRFYKGDGRPFQPFLKKNQE